MVLFSHQKKENESIIQSVREALSRTDTGSFECFQYQKPEAALERLLGVDADLISWDVSGEKERTAISSARKEHRKAFLLAVADKDVSPLEFLTPSIRPDSLLLRPITEKELERIAGEMKDAVCDAHGMGENEETMSITRRGERRQVPYSSIYFFEARGKKLYVRLRNEELGFAGTLEQLSLKLPSWFVRCHRSFIVNTLRIDNIIFSQNIICLRDGLCVPLSRSYKKAFKDGTE